MKTEEFNKIVEEIFDVCRKTLTVKQNEYNLDEDRLSFFKEGNELTKLSPERTLYMFMYKHIKSLADMVASEKKYPEALFLEKIKDNIDYLILLYALLKDNGMFSDGSPSGAGE